MWTIFRRQLYVCYLPFLNCKQLIIRIIFHDIFIIIITSIQWITIINELLNVSFWFVSSISCDLTVCSAFKLLYPCRVLSPLSCSKSHALCLCVFAVCWPRKLLVFLPKCSFRCYLSPAVMNWCKVEIFDNSPSVHVTQEINKAADALGKNACGWDIEKIWQGWGDIFMFWI